MNNLTIDEIKDLIIIGFNLHKKYERNIMTSKIVEKLIDDEVKKYLVKKTIKNEEK